MIKSLLPQCHLVGSTGKDTSEMAENPYESDNVLLIDSFCASLIHL